MIIKLTYFNMQLLQNIRVMWFAAADSASVEGTGDWSLVLLAKDKLLIITLYSMHRW